MSKGNPPSINPADRGSLPGVLQQAFAKMMQGVNGMLPAQVVAFNGNRNAPTVTVKPLIDVLTTKNERVPRALISSVPVFQLGAGGFLLSFPIRVGSLGWIMANDRDISLFKQSRQASQPQTLRRNNFADAVFFPDTMFDYSIAGEDADRAVMQSEDGSVRLALGVEFIKITSSLGINTDPAESLALDVSGDQQASRPWPQVTVGERDSIPSPQDGSVVWLSDLKRLSLYNAATGLWS